MKVFSTFSGISAASVAWKPMGYDFVAYAEPADFPSRVLTDRLGASSPIYKVDGMYDGPVKEGIPNFGDIEQITDEDLEELGPIDVLEGGSPCQAFSMAGLRRGFSDARGNLTLAFVNLALRMRKINGLRFVVWENVPGVLSHADNPLGCLLAALAGDEAPLQPSGPKWPHAGYIASPDARAAWRVLDAQYFGVPQRRKRVFLVASFDQGVDPGEVLFVEHGNGWAPEARYEARKDSGPSCQEDIGVVASLSMDSKGTIDSEGLAYALKASNGHNPQCVIHPVCNAGGMSGGPTSGIGIGEDGSPMYTILRSSVHGVIVHPKTVGTLMTHSGGTKHIDIEHTVVADHYVRRLLPVECERLMGYPDDWTNIDGATDAKRYAACGNSMAVPCMAFIGHQLKHYANLA